MEQTPRLLLFSLSCVLSCVLALAGIDGFMADVFTPDPPAGPADCAVATPAARTPSSIWLASYFGQTPPPGGTAAAPPAAVGEGWPIPPPGMMLEYYGWDVVIPKTPQTPVIVPSNEIWHVHAARLNGSTGDSAELRSFRLIVYSDPGDDELLAYGNNVTLDGNHFFRIHWGQQAAPGAANQHDEAMETLPNPFFVQPNWWLYLDFHSSFVGDELERSTFTVERFHIAPIKNTGGGGGGGGNWGGPWWAEA